MNRTQQTTLGDLISLFYEEFVEHYGDGEMASVAAAAAINDLLATTGVSAEEVEFAA